MVGGGKCPLAFLLFDEMQGAFRSKESKIKTNPKSSTDGEWGWRSRRAEPWPPDEVC